jgi:predicted PurR-regulated permease PerM
MENGRPGAREFLHASSSILHLRTMNIPSPTDRQVRILWFALTGLAIAIIATLIAGLIWGLGQVLQILAPVLWPLAVAGVIAYLLDPVVDWCERKGLSRPRAIVIVFVVALLIVAGIFGSVMPQIIGETRQFISRVPDISAKLEHRVEGWIDNPPAWLRRFFKDKSDTNPTPAPTTTTNTMAVASTTDTNAPVTPPENQAGLGGAIDQKTLHTATGWLATALPRIGRWLFGQVGRVASWFGVLVGLSLVPVYAFYLLLEKRRIESSWSNYLPMGDSNFKDEVVFVIHSINNYLIAFFRGQVLVAICDGVLYAIGFLIIDLPYAILLGTLAIVLTMIPFLGAIITCVLALVLAFVQHGDWLHPALVLAVFAVVQTLEGLVISPKIMGDRVGLHPLAIIIAVMAGTTLLGGLLGGILAIPLTAVLRVLMARYVWKKRDA